MSQTLATVRALIAAGKVRISDHAYDELANDGLMTDEIVNGAPAPAAVVVEDYPTFAKGPCVLVLQQDAKGDPIHALWGIPAGATEPAVLITVYRPDPTKWEPDWLRRR
jgi:hypothetical protein